MNHTNISINPRKGGRAQRREKELKCLAAIYAKKFGIAVSVTVRDWESAPHQYLLHRLT